MLDVKLKELIEIWNADNLVTRAELVVRLATEGQNVKRWMESAGFHEFKDEDDELRYKPFRGVVIKSITEKPEEGLTEKQRTEFYLGLGYNSHSIAVHQNVLLSTIETRRADFQKRVSKVDPIVTPEVTHEPIQMAICNPPMITIQETEEERENRVYEHNQNKDEFPEHGDAPPKHVTELVQSLFFPNGIPRCFDCQRDVLYGKLVVKYNENKKNAELTKIAKVRGKETYTSVPPYPKLILPLEVPMYFFHAFEEINNCPKTGHEEIDFMRNTHQFMLDTLDYLYEWRWNYLLRQLLAKRKERADKIAKWKADKARKMNEDQLAAQQAEADIADAQQAAEDEANRYYQSVDQN